ncbi:CvfB family protein [Lentibacillus saliphilus]|uniref:CvfB family protein n=1 Tax=Lentibacillus saliphilus TaxID=2737028 RepID=UPI001C2F1118|nr:S1-like domain-containing RNA-binding protein [Lentibacillus saliphilus]
MTQTLAGFIQTMTVKRVIDTGYVLYHEDTEALLHLAESDQELSENDAVDVFLYIDKKGQLTATTTLPKITRDAYGWCNVVEVIPNLGAFVNIGTTKDMLVSKDDLPLFERAWPKTDDKLYVTLGLDRKGRLLALPATEGVIQNMMAYAPEDLLNETVSGYVYHTSREGTALITGDHYRGFIHHTERKDEPRLGEFVTGRVIEVKEDGTINVSLRPLKQHSMSDDAEQILAYLKDNGGQMPFGDKSDPDDIRGTFSISKAAFKRALGKLLKDGYIEQRDGWTFLK